MKAWLLDGLGGLKNLRYTDVPDPKAGPGEVVLKMKYASLNPADRYLTEGLYTARPPLPHILGRDGIGTVSELGAGVAGIRAGDRFIILRGELGVTRAVSFAQRAAFPVQSLIDIP